MSAAADIAEVERLVRAAGTSFYRGMRILPPARRHAMYAIYAFCRIVDDIADGPAPLAEKRAALDAWRGRVAGLARGEADQPTTRVLAQAMRDYALREADFLAIIDGMETDAVAPVVAPTLADFDVYCDRVASAVGRLSVRAFGDASAMADEVAHHLGRALQMTNILRDLAEDAERGRLYLPREWLAEAGMAADPATALASPALPAVCTRLADAAAQHFAAAEAAMARCDPAAMRPARAMAATYAVLLRRLHRRHDVRARVSVPFTQKLWIAARFGLPRWHWPAARKDAA